MVGGEKEKPPPNPLRKRGLKKRHSLFFVFFISYSLLNFNKPTKSEQFEMINIHCYFFTLNYSLSLIRKVNSFWISDNKASPFRGEVGEGPSGEAFLLPDKSCQSINQRSLPVDGNFVGSIIFLFIVPFGCFVTSSNQIARPWLNFIIRA